MSVKAVFFDLDGTLMDTAPDFIDTLNQLCDEYHIDRIPEKKIRQTVSDGARALTTLALQLEEDAPGFEEGKQRLLSIYDDKMGNGSMLFDGMELIIQAIDKHRLDWGIVTNKPSRFADFIVSKAAMPSQPKLLLCPDHVSKPKPDPEVLLLACDKVGCHPREAIYIGDHKRDIDCGNDAGCITIAAAFGYIHENDDFNKWNADFIANKVQDILPIIETHL
jgi:phosphoglycolate phosphatase